MNASWLARPRSCRRRSGRRTGSEPIGLSRIAEAGARHLDRPRRAHRSPGPGRTRRSSGRGRASSARCGRRWTTFAGGMRAILATISSISVLLIVFFCLRLGQDALRRAGLVDHVDRLVGQVTVVDELAPTARPPPAARRRVLDAVVLLEARLQALQDLDRLLRPTARRRRPSGSAATARASFSKMPRYSVNVVAPMHFSAPVRQRRLQQVATRRACRPRRRRRRSACGSRR